MKLLGGIAAVALTLAVGLALIWPQAEEGYGAFQTQVARAEAEARQEDVAEKESGSGGSDAESTEESPEEEAEVSDEKLAEMKDKLSDEQYRVCFLKGTEPPFSGKFYKHGAIGAYHCAACQQELFKSDTKYDSGTGWPSFWDMSTDSAVEKVMDSTLGMVRWEVVCSNCEAHLGHVFDDGPEPSGLRYCINSLSLEFHGLDGSIERATDEKKEDSAE